MDPKAPLPPANSSRSTSMSDELLSDYRQRRAREELERAQQKRLGLGRAAFSHELCRRSHPGVGKSASAAHAVGPSASGTERDRSGDPTDIG